MKFQKPFIHASSVLRHASLEFILPKTGNNSANNESDKILPSLE